MSSIAPVSASSEGGERQRGQLRRRRRTGRRARRRARAPTVSPRPRRCRRPAASAPRARSAHSGAPARSARAGAAARAIRPALSAAATTSTRPKRSRHCRSAVPQRTPLHRHHAIFKLKRAVVDPPSADAQTSLSGHRGLVFRLPFPADGPDRASRPGSRSWWRRACAITRPASRPKAAASCSLENERAQPRQSRGVARLLPHLCGSCAHERPDIVHCIALRMVVLGGLAARAGGAKRLVLAPTGLGHVVERRHVSRSRGRARRARASSSGRWLQRAGAPAICSRTPTIRANSASRLAAAGDDRARRGRRSAGISAFAGARRRRR